MALPFGSKKMVPLSVEQKLRLPPPEMGNAVEKYPPAGFVPIPVELKLYPFFVPEASSESMRQAFVSSGAVQVVPLRAVSDAD